MPEAVHDFVRHRRGMAGLALITALLLFCFAGPLIHPTDQIHANVAITNWHRPPRTRSEPTPTATTCWGG